MNKIKNSVVAFVLGLVLVVGAAACGDSDDDPPTTPPSDPETTEPVGS